MPNPRSVRRLTPEPPSEYIATVQERRVCRVVGSGRERRMLGSWVSQLGASVGGGLGRWGVLVVGERLSFGFLADDLADDVGVGLGLAEAVHEGVEAGRGAAGVVEFVS